MIFPRGAKKISPPAELRSLSLDWDCKGNIFFRFCKIFLNFFEALQFLASSVRPPLYSGLSPLILRSIAILKRTLPPPLSKGTAKVLIISNFPNIFKKFWKKSLEPAGFDEANHHPEVVLTTHLTVVITEI